MNRAERRKFKKKLGKELEPIATKIIQWHKEYEGKDDSKLEELVANEIKTLDFNQLMLLTVYLESTIGNADS